MIAPRWEVSESDGSDENFAGRPHPTLVSLHFIRSALRRRRLACVLCAVLGLLASVAFLVMSPASHHARAALVLTHDPQADPSRGMATDVSLLRTRTVANKAIADLGLAMTPDAFLKSVNSLPVSSDLLSLSVTAPSDAEAVRRLTALTSIYLSFRGEQLSIQSNLLVSGMQQHITQLQAELEAISGRIDQLSASRNPDAGKLSDAIERRTYIQGTIETLQQSIEDAKLRNSSVLASSRVIDPPAADTGGTKRRMVMILASGFIGGAALGCGAVLFFAIISDRLRRRSDVAAALEVPVPVSVGRVLALPKRWLWLPHIKAINARRTEERERLAHAIEMELPSQRQSGRLGVLCIDNAEEVSFAVATAATNLAADGHSVAVIDLTKQGSLELGGVSSTMGASHRPTVLRPDGIPVLAGSIADLHYVGTEDRSGLSLDRTDITLVLADLDPSVGADFLSAWTDRVIIAVTAGLSSVGMVTTAAELVRTAGLEFRMAALLHAERTDDSSGTAGFDLPVPVPVHIAEDRLTPVGKSGEEKQAVNEEQAALKRQTGDQEQAAVVEEQRADEQLAEEAQVAGELIGEDQTHSEESAVNDEEDLAATVEEAPAAQDQPEEELIAEQEASAEEQAAVLEEQPANQEQPLEEELTAEQEAPPEKQAAALEEQPADEEQPAANQKQVVVEDGTPDQDQVVVKDETPDQEQAAEERLADEDQPAGDEQVPEQESAAVLPEQPAEEEQAAEAEQVPEEKHPTALPEQSVDAEATDSDEQAAALQEQLTNEELRAEESTEQDEALAEEQAREEELAEVSAAQPTYELPSLDGDPTIQVRVAFTYEQPSGEQTHVIEQVAKDGEVESQLVADPDLVAGFPEQTTNGRRWQLFFVQNPLLQIEPSPGDDELDWSWDWLDEPVFIEESAAVVAEDELELFVEPDEVPYPSLEDVGVNGWILYIDVYRATSTPLMQDDELNWNFDWDWDLGSEKSGRKQNGSGNGHGAEVSAEADAR